MLMCEFLTAVHHRLPVKVVVYNSSSLGLIRLEAESMGLPAWKAMDFPNPDYVAIARACGAVGFSAEKPSELREAIDQALKAEGPAIVSCVVRLMNCPTSRTSIWRRPRISPRQRLRKPYSHLRAGDRHASCESPPCEFCRLAASVLAEYALPCGGSEVFVSEVHIYLAFQNLKRFMFTLVNMLSKLVEPSQTASVT
jgi:hypothetical protein